MQRALKDIANLSSGVYAKPDISPNLLYLQSLHFNGFGEIDPLLKPQVKLNGKYEKHLLKDDDVLFAAKGVNNFGVVYNTDMGAAIASSSFIVIRLIEELKNKILPDYLAWFLGNTPQIKELHQQQLGTTIPSISIRKLYELDVSIPPIEKQQLVIRLNDLRKKEKQLVRQIDNLREKEMKQLLINALNHN